MAKLLWFLSMALTAIVLGTISAIYATQTLRPTGMLEVGPWEAVRAVGDAAADPYAHAFLASSGQLPPGSAEGMRFVALASSSGQPLVPGCTITVSGLVDVARLWTLTLAAPNGEALSRPDAARPLALHSQDLIYTSDGGFELTIGPRPQTVNTVFVSSQQPISLVLHVYDGALTSAPENGEAALPRISVGADAPGCA
ncbi:MAG: DUF1214 domain-containing protein [Devosiaceae bacterium]